MSIFDLQAYLLKKTGKHFVQSQKLESAVLSFFDRVQSIDTTFEEEVVAYRTGPYINIDLTEQAWNTMLQRTFTLPPFQQRAELFWIEYFSPNVAKQLHIGHVRNINTGIALQNLIQLRYPNIVFDSHLGDWGIQFGVLLWSVRRLQELHQTRFKVSIMDEEVIVDQQLLSEDPAAYYTYLYVWGNQQKASIPTFDDEVREIFLRLSKGDIHLKLIWQEIVEVCSKANEKEVRLLHMPTPDYVLGESVYEDELKRLLTFVEEHGLLVQDNKARYLDYSALSADRFSIDHQVMLQAVVGKDTTQELGRGYWISSTGYSTYLSRDIAARIMWARDYEASHALTITDNSQAHHMRQVILACAWLSTLPEFLQAYGEKVVHLLRQGIEHIGYGRVVLKSGKMSTRRGNFVTAEDVIASTLSEAKTILKEKNPTISTDELDTNAQAVARAALKWNDLKTAIHQDSVFDLESLLSFEGNTGVYQLYTYARLRSILKKTTLALQSNAVNVANLNTEEKTLLRQLYLLPLIVQEALEKREPHRLTNWLTKLTQSINSWYSRHSVSAEANPVRQSTLFALVARLTEGQKIALELLGITPVDTL